MATIELTKQYRHSEDCVQAGCPTHQAKFTYQSTSDYYMFEPYGGKKIFFERGELEAFLILLREMYDMHCSCIDIRDYMK